MRLVIGACLLIVASSARGAELTSGELYDTAYTMEPRESAVHPLFLPSNVGLSERVDLKLNFVSAVLYAVPRTRNFLPPRLSVEYGLFADEQHALSLEPGLVLTGSVAKAEMALRYSRRLGEHHVINVALAPGSSFVFDNQYGSEGFGVGGSASVSWHILPSAQTTWQLGAELDLFAVAAGEPLLKPRVHWNHGWERFRLGLGVDAWIGEPAVGVYEAINDLLAEEGSDFALPEIPFLPMPYVALWWRMP